MVAVCAERQAKILEIVQKQVISTQKDLLDALCLQGYSVTQATVSRDIQRLHLTKETCEDGQRRYTMAKTMDAEAQKALMHMFRHAVVSVQRAANLVVIRTVNAGAAAAAAAIDELNMPDVVGTVAGDDTIFVAAPTEAAARAMSERFTRLLRTGKL